MNVVTIIGNYYENGYNEERFIANETIEIQFLEEGRRIGIGGELKAIDFVSFKF